MNPDVLPLPYEGGFGCANGKTTEQAAGEAGIVEQTYYRWRRENTAAVEGRSVIDSRNRLEGDRFFAKWLVPDIKCSWVFEF